MLLCFDIRRFTQPTPGTLPLTTATMTQGDVLWDVTKKITPLFVLLGFVFGFFSFRTQTPDKESSPITMELIAWVLGAVLVVCLGAWALRWL